MDMPDQFEVTERPHGALKGETLEGFEEGRLRLVTHFVGLFELKPKVWWSRRTSFEAIADDISWTQHNLLYQTVYATEEIHNDEY